MKKPESPTDAHSENDPTRRFSSRVEDYVNYRPGYPPVILDLLRREAGLTPKAVIADVGSGTGNLSRLFLENGNRVYGLEPNEEMRAAGVRLLAGYERFISLRASAEATTLPGHSVDFVTAGQAFHWFDRARARSEFCRILRPQGVVVLVWNDWSEVADPFMRACRELMETSSPEFNRVRHKNVSDEDVLAEFFNPGSYRLHRLGHAQVFDFPGLRGRFLSSSYAPLPGHPNHQTLLTGLRTLFDRFQDNGQVRFLYDTWLYFGRLI